MTSAVFDTNIIIDRLNNHPVAAALIDSVDIAYVSLMTFMEVMVFVPPGDNQVRSSASELFAALEIVGIDEVCELAVQTKQNAGGKFPDAIIHATALKLGIQLFTRDRGIKPVTFMPDIDIVAPYSSHDTPEQLAETALMIRERTQEARELATLRQQWKDRNLPADGF